MTQRNKSFYFQLLFWVSFFVFLFMQDAKMYQWQFNIFNSLLYTSLVIGLVYFNVFVLIPRFFFQKKYVIYVLFGLVASFLLSVFYSFAENQLFQIFELDEPIFTDFSFYDIFYPFFQLTALAGALSSIFIAFQQIQSNEKLVRVEKAKTDSQLKYLRAQVNPHFLFNVLNTIHFLIPKNQEKASETLMQLSELLRYQLYETTEDRVSLEKELNHLQNYIELERMRIGKNLQFSSNLNEKHHVLQIAPFLLLPLVENAFKHSTNADERMIQIALNTTKNSLHFETKNSNGTQKKTKASGLGLQNLKQRLQLLYPNRHHFTHYEENDIFHTKLELQL